MNRIINPYIENHKVLYVDDEKELLKSFLSLMRKENCSITTLNNSTQIEEVIKNEGPFAVILSDQKMPGFDGVKVLEICRSQSPGSIRVLVTGYSDHNDTVKAINIGGINSYISKPWDDNEIKRNIREWIAYFNLKEENQYLLTALDVENEKLNELLDGTVVQTVKVLGDIAGHVSPQVALFGEKVKLIGKSFLECIHGISTEERWDIMRALDLFNIGITLLPVSVQAMMNKEGLSALEKSTVANNHHLLAAGLLKNIPRFKSVARIIELQSKNYDGSGEPKNDNIKGEQIPVGARLLKILIDLVKHETSTLNVNDDLLKFENSSNKYDIELIRSIRLRQTKQPSISGETFLPVSKLEAGMLILEDITTLKGRQLLLKSGSILSGTFINILLQWHKRDPIKEPVKIRNDHAA